MNRDFIGLINGIYNYRCSMGFHRDLAGFSDIYIFYTGISWDIPVNQEEIAHREMAFNFLCSLICALIQRYEGSMATNYQRVDLSQKWRCPESWGYLHSWLVCSQDSREKKHTDDDWGSPMTSWKPPMTLDSMVQSRFSTRPNFGSNVR